MYYQKAREKAVNNGEVYHLAAILIRKKNIIRIGTNSAKTHPKFLRTYENGDENAGLHAEMDVLRFAKPGDILMVYRFSAKGIPTMAKPCKHCQGFIREAGISKVFYTNWSGELKRLDIDLD